MGKLREKEREILQKEKEWKVTLKTSIQEANKHNVHDEACPKKESARITAQIEKTEELHHAAMTQMKEKLAASAKIENALKKMVAQKDAELEKKKGQLVAKIAEKDQELSKRNKQLV